LAIRDKHPEGGIPHIINSKLIPWPPRSLPAALTDYIKATGPDDVRRRTIATHIYLGMPPSQQAQVNGILPCDR